MKETRTLQVRFAPNFGDLARAIGELIATDPPPEAEVTIALYERGVNAPMWESVKAGFEVLGEPQPLLFKPDEFVEWVFDS